MGGEGFVFEVGLLCFGEVGVILDFLWLCGFYCFFRLGCFETFREGVLRMIVFWENLFIGESEVEIFMILLWRNFFFIIVCF